MDDLLKRKLISIESKLIEHSYPPQLVIENTSQCDQQCIHCSHKEMLRPKKQMDRLLWEKNCSRNWSKCSRYRDMANILW